MTTLAAKLKEIATRPPVFFFPHVTQGKHSISFSDKIKTTLKTTTSKTTDDEQDDGRRAKIGNWTGNPQTLQDELYSEVILFVMILVATLFLRNKMHLHDI